MRAVIGRMAQRQRVAGGADLVPHHPDIVAVHRHVGMAGAGGGDGQSMVWRVAGVELAVPDRGLGFCLVPHGMAGAVGADGKARAVVRAAGDMPVAEGGACGGCGLPLRGQHGVGVVADVVAVDAAEEGGDVALRRCCQGDAAAFAALVDQLAFGNEGDTTVVGPAVIHRRPKVRFFCGFRGQQVALVDPGDHDAAVAVDRQRVEAVGDFGAVVVHGDGGGEVRAAIQRPGKPHEAGPRLGARLRPAHVDLVVRAERQLGAIFTLGVDPLGFGVDRDGCAQAAAIIVGMPQPHVAVGRIDHPQTAMAVERRAGAQLGCLRHVAHVVRVRKWRQQANQHEEKSAHQIPSKWAFSPSPAKQGRVGEGLLLI